MRKIFSNQSNSWIVLPVFTLAMAWNFAQGARVPAPVRHYSPGLANSVALGPTMPPPCCDVTENGAGLPVALGPTMPPPCCDVTENGAGLPVALGPTMPPPCCDVRENGAGLPVALGPTMPPPCCDVRENGAGLPVALGPTMPPPCCDAVEIIRAERSHPSLAADPSSDFTEGAPVSRQFRAALRIPVAPQAGEGVRVI